MFSFLATASMDTKRNPAPSSGNYSGPSAHLTGLAITPLAPVDERLQEKYELKSPRTDFVCYAPSAADVLLGDEATVSGVVYQVVGVGQWSLPGYGVFAEIILELAQGG